MAKGLAVGDVIDRVPPRLVNKALQVLPEGRRAEMELRRAQHRFETFMRERLGPFYVPVDRGPMARTDIVMRTRVLTESDAEHQLQQANYFSSAYGQLVGWIRTAEKYGFNLRTARAALELGTGSARLLRHLRCVESLELYGTDVDGDSIAWCKQNISGISFHVNGLEPPLPFAHENMFDLAFANSVFTHIPLETQKEWVAEMFRVMRPGGIFICTVLGHMYQQSMLNQAQRDELHRVGHLQLDSNSEQASVSTQIIGSWEVFQTRRENIEVFGAQFEVCDFLPRPNGQDVLVLRKPR